MGRSLAFFPAGTASGAANSRILNREASSGATSSDTANETSSAKIIVSESDLKNDPATPERNAKGIWMTMVLALDPTIAGMISDTEEWRALIKLSRLSSK